MALLGSRALRCSFFRFVAIATCLGLPASAQDLPGASVITPVGWVLIGVLSVCFVILIGLVVTLPAVRSFPKRRTGLSSERRDRT